MIRPHPNLRRFCALARDPSKDDPRCGYWKDIPSAAIFSPDEVYRYALARIWDDTKPLWLFAMLNPSKATHEEGDPTVDRQVKRAMRHDVGGIIVVNAGALRETKRKLALRHADPIGPDNGFWVARVAPLAETIILAHGPDAARFKGDLLLRNAFRGRDCHALHLTKNGSPGHPLYIAYDAPLIAYRGTSAA